MNYSPYPYRGACANYICTLYGCQGYCGYQRLATPTYIPTAPRGCVCPVGAEKTCQGFGCPRKPTFATASGIETEGHDPAEGHGAEHESPAPKGDAHD